MRKAVASVVLVGLVCSACAIPQPPKARMYEGQSVVRAQVNTQAKHDFVESLGLDTWKEFPNGDTDVRVDGKTMALLESAGIDYVTYIPDLAELIEQSEERRAQYKHTRDVWFEEYHTYDEQVAYYNDLCSAPRCTRLAIGTSELGNTQYQYTIDAGHDRAIFLDAGIHAREWISSATLQYIFTELLNNPTNETNAFTWIIHGHQNPDGYEFSWSNDRLWRKSRNQNPGSACIGTDLNRNYPTTTWGGPGSSPNPCSDTFHGAGAGSEPETANLVSRFRAALSEYEIPVAISFHSYSQLLLRQWGHTQQNSPDETAERTLGALMVQAIEDTHGLVYENIKSIELYATTGTTGDWYYENSTDTYIGQGTFGFTYELRDTGRYGFVLPEEQIIPQGEEIWASILAMVEWLVAQ